MVIPGTSMVFGAQTNHGHIPAFFTDESAARQFFTDKQASGLLARCDRLEDFRNLLEASEKVYVLLDGNIMTMREFTQKFGL